MSEVNSKTVTVTPAINIDADRDAPPIKYWRRGDIVYHRPSGETWVIRRMTASGGLIPCGWPKSRAEAQDCVWLAEATSRWLRFIEAADGIILAQLPESVGEDSRS